MSDTASINAPDAGLDGLVRLAARLCDAPIAQVALVDATQQVFTTQIGLDGHRSAPLAVGFSPLVAGRGETVVIPDTLADPAHAANPAIRTHGVRFYAGVPLATAAGHVLGALCVADRVPRARGLTPAQLDGLHTLAVQVVTGFEWQRALGEQDALTRSAARYRTLFDAVDDGFCIIEFFDGPHGPLGDDDHIEANGGYERHTGIADIVGRTLRGLLPAAEAEGWIELFGGVLRTGEPIRFERDFATARRFIEVSATRIEPASLRQVAVLFRDATGRKQAEAALLASEAVATENIQRVQMALGAGAIIGTWLWDLLRDRVTLDEPCARAFGLDPALGRTGLGLAQVFANVHPDDVPGLMRAIDEVLGRGGAYAHQYRVRREDGRTTWIEANGRVELAPDGTPLSFPGVLIDVGERRGGGGARPRHSGHSTRRWSSCGRRPGLCPGPAKGIAPWIPGVLRATALSGVQGQSSWPS